MLQPYSVLPLVRPTSSSANEALAIVQREREKAIINLCSNLLETHADKVKEGKESVSRVALDKSTTDVDGSLILAVPRNRAIEALDIMSRSRKKQKIFADGTDLSLLPKDQLMAVAAKEGLRLSSKELKNKKAIIEAIKKSRSEASLARRVITEVEEHTVDEED